MRPTSDERREVARRIRNNLDEQASWVIPWAVFNDADHHGDRETMERLADLIDPTCAPEAHNYGSIVGNACPRCGWSVAGYMRYCPGCGARVVRDDD